ncbi:unnamed protein product [Notodromas monacha]|uniref:type I protein arginine methyltransferase n=1 Tax=Notodromas monacha TaxID=399045 RepID=A0A7R9C065_9CRUS|nr:unnamed protein product [Notodromas monacha]CAG0923764.1 unnamed protein product [Notodromas monacha]
MSDSESDADSSSWVEVETAEERPVLCLFCPDEFSCCSTLWHHVAEEHGFNIRENVKSFGLDEFGYIRMINYIRKCNPSSGEKLSPEDWISDEFLVPVLTDDPLLSYDIEDPGEDNGGEGDQRMDPSAEEVIRGKDMLIGNLLRDIGVMRTTFQSVVLEGGDDLPGAKKERERRCQGAWDDGYFSAYGHHSIHQEMLQDRVRTGSYRDAILKNKDLIAGKKVLDLGCGTGILSMFCVQADAAQVIGVDNAEVIVNTYDIVRENNMEKHIKLIRGAIEDLGHEAVLKDVDVIVSEWMGYFLLFEGMLKSVMFARDNYLKPGGLILPNRCDLYIAAVSDRQQFDRNVNMWDDVYGFKMTSMKNDYLKEVSVEVVRSENVVAEPILLKSFDLNTCSQSDLCVETKFEFVINRKCELTCLAGYFDAVFDLPVPVTLGTGPANEPTHWKQAIFYLRQPMPVAEGEKVSGVMKFYPRPEDRRAYGVSIQLRDLVLKKVIH